jgi:tetratricopeptide (TPR) repeat protein
MDLHPYLQLGRIFYAQALLDAGRLEEALTQYQLARVLSPDLPWLGPLEAVCLIKLGRRPQACAMYEELEDLRQTEYVDGYFMAVLFEALGERRRAFQELERAVEENSAALFTLDVDPKMDVFRGDPRFDRLRSCIFSAARAH